MNDLRFAFRQLLKRPAFTVVALIAFAVGVGINTTIFTFIDRLLLRPLELADSDRLLTIWGTAQDARGRVHDRQGIAPADFRDWQRESTTLGFLAAYDGCTLDLSGTGEAERLIGYQVTANFFTALAAPPARGTHFGEETEIPGRDDVMVLSHRLWERAFAGDPSVVGQTVRLGGRTRVVTAVMPAEFDFPTGAEFWIPLAHTPEAWSERGHGSLQTIGRLKDGVSVRQAQSELRAIAGRLGEAYPATNATRGVNPLTLHERTLIESGSGVPLALAGGATGFVLLLVCANLANYQLARGLSRTREMAIRLALGARRGQLIRQLLTESTLLAVAGGFLGTVVSVWGVAAMKAAMPASTARFITGWSQVGLNARALVFTLGVAALAGILAGLAPALAVSQPAVGETLKEGGHQVTLAGRRSRMRNGLVVFEVCLAFVLLVGAGLLVKSFLQFSVVDTGMEVTSVVAATVELPPHRYEQPAQVAGFRREVVEFLDGLPGADGVALSSRSPVDTWWPRLVEFADSTASPPGQWRPIAAQSVSPDFFSILRIPQRQGRVFTAGDGAAAPRVAVISESLAARCFPEDSALGRRLRVDGLSDGEWITVIGVVGDIKAGVQARSQEAIYFTVDQEVERSMTWLVRSTADPDLVIAGIREGLRRIDPELPLLGLGTLRAQLIENLGGLRVMAGLLAITGLLALGLSALGIYTVMAQTVVQRTQEIGIRVALGATAGDVMGLVMRGGMRLAGLGLALGLPLALGLGWILSQQLGQETMIAAVEPVPLATVVLLLAAASMVACWLPARRAAGVDPMTALRCE